jgi:DNA-binding MarR family transcriptional regulator
VDHIDRVIAEWKRERPDLDLAPVRVIGRMGRVLEHVDRELEATFMSFGISRATFDVLAALYRAGKPYQLTQRALTTMLMRTSGSMSLRIAAIERAGYVKRKPDPADGRSSFVTLARAGMKVVEAAAPAHLANERRLLSPFTDSQCATLAGLLAQWIAWFEPE